MTTQSIRTAGRSEAEQCTAVIVRAFNQDPAARWIYPDDDQYQKHFPQLVKAFGGGAFEHDTGQYVDGFLASALWLPPGVLPDEEALTALIEHSISGSHRDEVLALFGQMDTWHPREPHWHLPLIGTDPGQQGKGLGSDLLRHALAVCDQQRMPAYLEATTQRNVSLYRRHGFEVLGTIQVNTSPTITPMLRKPRGRTAADRRSALPAYAVEETRMI